MIVYISTNSYRMPMRLLRYKGTLYMFLDDVVALSSHNPRFTLSNENVERICNIVGEKNFNKLEYGSMKIPLPCISYNGLKELIDFPNIDKYLRKDDLVIIYECITKNKIKIDRGIDDEVQENKVTAEDKIEYSYLRDKIREMEHHINEIKRHLDTVLKIQDELINIK